MSDPSALLEVGSTAGGVAKILWVLFSNSPAWLGREGAWEGHGILPEKQVFQVRRFLTFPQPLPAKPGREVGTDTRSVLPVDPQRI
jgi:hypothetical protein